MVKRRVEWNPRLEPLENRELLTTYTVLSNANAGGSVGNGLTLRQAILLASGGDTIDFAIPGNGTHTIQLSTELPPIRVPITIDGSTQPAFPGHPVIVIDGSQLSGSSVGLRLESGSSTIKSLAINAFPGDGILMTGSNSTVQGCFIGVSANGAQNRGNGGNGITLATGSSANLIGGDAEDANVISGNRYGIRLSGDNDGNRIASNFIGTDSSGSGSVPNIFGGIFLAGGVGNIIGAVSDGTQTERSGGNVISGNNGDGITLFSIFTTGNSVLGNYIGTNADGTSIVANGGDGISIIGAPGNVIGGRLINNGNVISGNKGTGISFTGGDRTGIFGNFIGTDVNGVANLGNLGPGIFDNGATNVSIGGSLAGAGNIIAFNGSNSTNGKDGIQIFSGNSVSILGNSIFSNAGLGINLWNVGDPTNGVTQNDFKDNDTGANDLQNYPVLSLASTGQSSGGTGTNQTIVRGTINSQPATTYRIEFFSSTQADPSAHGEGQTFLGSTLVSTDLNGNGTIKLTLPKGSTIGQYVTATATDPAGNTSEFSPAQVITQANIADLDLRLTAPQGPAAVNASLVYTLTVTNNGAGTANNVILTDTLPAGIGNVTNIQTDHGTYSILNGVVTVQLGNLAKDEVATITIPVTPLIAGQITNTASLASDDIDPDLSNNTRSVTTDVNIPADLALNASIEINGTQIPSIDAANGQTFVILLVVSNNGPGPASNVVVTDDLPSNVVYVSSEVGSGTVNVIGNRVIASLGTINNDTLSTVRITVRATLDAEPPGTLESTKTDASIVTRTEQDPVSSNDTSHVTITVKRAADLGVTMSAEASPVADAADSRTTLVDGQTLTYTITVTNDGPDDATGLTIKDVLPPGVTFLSAEDANHNPILAVPVNGTLTLPVGTLGFRSSTTLYVTISDEGGSGAIVNKVTVLSNQADSTPANDSAEVSTIVNPADLAVSTTTSPGIGLVGSQLVYHVTVRNNGPATAHGVVLKNLLPSGVDLVGTPTTDHGWISSIDPQTIVATIGNLPNGDTATLTFIVIPTNSGIITNTASVQSDNDSVSDIDSSNNSYTSRVSVSPTNLAIRVVPSADSVLIGDLISYQVTVTNFGAADATGVTLVDVLPTNAELVSAVAADGSRNIGRIAGNLVAAIGNLASGQSYTLTLTFNPLAEGTLVNSFNTFGDQFDPDDSNNSVATSATIRNAPGVVNFSQAVYQSGDNAGSALITVQRTGGTAGFLTVGFTTAGGTAVAGTNYEPVAGTFTFGPGETVKTFLVPIHDDGEVTGNKTVNLLLTDTGGSPIGSQGSAIINIVETDVDLVAPSILDIQLDGTNRAITGVTVTFSEPLNPATAQNLANYSIIAPPIRGRRGSQTVSIIGAVYNPANNSVALSFSHGVAAGVFTRLNITGVTDRFNNVINGGIYSATFGRGANLTYADSNGDVVNLRLSGGGVIDLFRQQNGEAGIMRLVGTVPGRSTLNGSVRRRPSGDGVTTLQRIDGLGTFGAVRSRLRTPPFVVTDRAPQSTVTVASVPTLVRPFHFRRRPR
jgi:uncharacterized repeat protein (TIGR01451 family)